MEAGVPDASATGGHHKRGGQKRHHANPVLDASAEACHYHALLCHWMVWDIAHQVAHTVGRMQQGHEIEMTMGIRWSTSRSVFRSVRPLHTFKNTHGHPLCDLWPLLLVNGANPWSTCRGRFSQRGSERSRRDLGRRPAQWARASPNIRATATFGNCFTMSARLWNALPAWRPPPQRVLAKLSSILHGEAKLCSLFCAARLGSFSRGRSCTST